ncbi:MULTISPECIES: SMC-Scp complex subunit ScpB [unclassified Fusibacter]|uniref:SMC-Scp complex subunit ScpB n=1 Tax=unclassified Fusibacter TaxID=2624464 RepID=UPI0013E93687|nr:MULTISPECIES: SMC-Scp complex subunit ScpB [unclassified Fusibacter]MCK8058860.1 SMC-Scp complex subunit ScpB [Fusibacter sp. A2]NPE21935.1 SMC-Scp complex subunit ScpB [Fusibacter sp. A1]
MLNQNMKQIEALLFAWGEALSYQRLAALTGLSQELVKEEADNLRNYYDTCNHAIQLLDVNQSVQLATRHEVSDVVEQLFVTDKNKGLSVSNLEVLSIIAYKQPITKTEIERIRGVKCDRAVQILLELELIRISGKLERIGRPNLFSTTDLFLKKFGLKTLRELPPVASFERMQIALFDEEEEENGEQAASSEQADNSEQTDKKQTEAETGDIQ